MNFNKPKRRHVKEIPLAPVLDLLTVVVFFLILSTSFVELKQNEIPPAVFAKVESSSSDPSPKVPKNPKLLIAIRGESLTLVMKWMGTEPGQVVENIPRVKEDYSDLLKEKSSEMVKNFLAKFPEEKTLQIGFASQVRYQEILTSMDGVLNITKDIALISNTETDMLISGSL